jgi:HK97 gp10 family phage protein
MGGFCIGVNMADLVRVEGLDGVKAALDKFDAKVQDHAMRTGLRAAGAVMQGAVGAAAPVLDERTAGSNALPVGALKSDITLQVTRKDGVLMAIVQPGKLTYYVARWVEYGHMLVKGGRLSMKRGKLQGSGKTIGHVPAHPFIRPAFDATVGTSVQAFAAALKEDLKRRG